MSDIQQIIEEGYQSAKVEMQMFRDQTSVLDELYQASMDATFRGLLEVITAKMEQVKTVDNNSQVKFHGQVTPSGKALYFVSLLCRQIDL
jgi:hypothetical protein